MATREQTGELARLEPELREHVPQALCDPLVLVIGLAEQRDMHMESARMHAEALVGSPDAKPALGSIVEGMIESGVVRRSDMLEMAKISNRLYAAANFGGTLTDQETRTRRKYVARILEHRQKDGAVQLLPDAQTVSDQLDNSLANMKRMTKSGTVTSLLEIQAEEENATLLHALIGIEAGLLADIIPEDQLKGDHADYPEQARANTLALLIDGLGDGGVEEFLERCQDAFHDPEVIDDVLSRVVELKKIGTALDDYTKKFYPMAGEYSRRIKECVPVFEATHQQVTESIVHILTHIPTALREGIDDVNAPPETKLERVMGVLCVENWVEAVYAHVGIEVAPEEAKPLHALITRLEQEESLAALEQALEPLHKSVAKINEKYVMSSRFLREREGLGLRRALENYVEPGSNKALFSKDQAQQIAVLALLTEDVAKAGEFAYDAAELSQLWADIAFLAPRTARSGLVRTLDALKEWHESAPAKLLNDKDLAPVWKLAELLEAALAEDLSTPPSKEGTEEDEPAPTAGSDQERATWRIPAEFAHVEFIEPFPPGHSGDIVSDLEGISRGWKGGSVEWGRIYSLVDLRKELESQGYGVMTHRLLQTEWHPLPHYVLEVMNPRTGRVTAVVESPIYGNASYVIPDEDWREIVRFSKEDVRREWGGMAKVHAPNSSAAEHREKLKNAVIAHT